MSNGSSLSSMAQDVAWLHVALVEARDCGVQVLCAEVQIARVQGEPAFEPSALTHPSKQRLAVASTGQ
jgi:hypothetical protein